MDGKGLGTWKTLLRGNDFKEGPNEDLPPYVIPTEQFKSGENIFRDKLYAYLAGIYPDELVIQQGFMDLDTFFQKTDDINIKKFYKSEIDWVILSEKYPTPLCGRKVFIIKFNVRDGKFVEWNFKDKKFVYSQITKSGDYIKTRGQYATGLNKAIGYEEQSKIPKNSSSNMFDDFLEEGTKDNEEEEEEEEDEFSMNYQRSTIYFDEYLNERLCASIKALSETKKPNLKEIALSELEQAGFTKDDDGYKEALIAEVEKQKLKWEKFSEIVHLFCIADMPYKQTKKIKGTKVTWWTMYVHDSFFLVDPVDE